MFSVMGKWSNSRDGNYKVVYWNEGELFGSPDAVARAVDLAKRESGNLIGPPTGPYTEADHLASDLSALFILLELFDPTTIVVRGDIPVAPPVPEDAIA